MSLKPTEEPRWATDGGAPITTPLAAKLDDGFAADEEPPAQYLNWVLNRIFQMTNWLFVGIFARASLTDKTLIFATADQNQRERAYVAAMGFVGGPAVQQQFIARALGTTTAGIVSNQVVDPGLAVTLDTNTELVEAGPGGLSGAPTCNLVVLDAATSLAEARLHTQGAAFSTEFAGDLNDNVILMECDIDLNQIGASEVDVFIGLHERAELGSGSYGLPTSFNFAMFEKLSGDTNWQLSVGDGVAGTSNDSGTPPVASTKQHFRLEYHGLNTPVGVDTGFATVRFFIDGVFEGEIADANVPDGGQGLGLGIRASATATGPSSDFIMRVGPIRIACVHTLGATPPQN